MKILFISDWHGHDYELPDEKIDVLVCLGDMDWKQIERLDKKFDCSKLGLLGNHDRWDNYHRTGFTHLHKQVVDLFGVKFAGFDGSPRYNFKDSPQYEEDEVYDFVNDISDVDVFIAHSNPMLQPSFDKTDAHRGFMAFTEYITKAKPSYFVYGHNHEEKIEKMGITQVICVFPYLLLEI